MKILFINISDLKGGSAKAAYRLGKFFEQNYNTDNLYLVRTKIGNDPKVLQTRRNMFQHIFERFVNIIMNILGMQYQWLPFSPRFILKKAKEFKPDVISLHNTIGGYFRTKDLSELSKIAPVVWTLHDMWAFTNNASHTYGNENWKKMRSFPGENKVFPWTGIKWGNWLLKQKARTYSESNIHFVAPSLWMYNMVKESPALSGKMVTHIYHGINDSVYKPFNKTEARNGLNIDPNNKVLLFVAEKVKKNKEELENILSTLNKKLKKRITFVILGNSAGLKKNFDRIDLVLPGYIIEEEMMARYYSAADLFIYPTRAESFGLVLAESIACGTPCISNDVGPVKEIVKEKISGYLIPVNALEDVCKKAIEVLENNKLLEELSVGSKKHFMDNFTLKKMAGNYFELYKSVIS